jgi:NAD(P)-dependent dehydrogenase (short-subunit alcohol dehydrogenase family)
MSARQKDEDAPQRAALVTAGAAGLGKSVAAELARRGWAVFLQHSPSVRDAAGAAEQVAAAARDVGLTPRVASGAADLTAPADREQLVEQVLEQFGRIDMLVNAPPSHPHAAEDLLELTEETYYRVLDTALTATLFLTQLVANEMVRLVEAGELSDPRIVTINSISAYTTSADHGPQCIARAGLSMVTRLFADVLGDRGINAYEVRVGLISAGPRDASHGRYDALIAEGLTPLRRWGRASDVARAVAAVADDLLPFSTGEVLNVDGGFHLRRL